MVCSQGDPQPGQNYRSTTDVESFLLDDPSSLLVADETSHSFVSDMTSHIKQLTYTLEYSVFCKKTKQKKTPGFFSENKIQVK